MSDEVNESSAPRPMSEQVSEAITGVLQQNGFMSLGFVLMATFEEAEGDKSWCMATSEGQLMATSLGLVDIMRLKMEYMAARDFIDPHDPDCSCEEE